MAGDHVGRLERAAGTNRDRFLAGIKMHQSRRQSGPVKLAHLVFKRANGDHGPVEFGQSIGR
jgi:hypothetical protein